MSLLFSTKDAEDAVSLIGCLLEHLEAIGHSGLPATKHPTCQACNDMESAETFLADVNA